MPAYRTHVSLNLFLGLPLSLAALKYTVSSTPIDLSYFAAAFIYGTLFLHPDVDLARNVRLFSLKGLLTLPFRPYSYLFRHRGFSHMPVVGTLSRVAWLMGFLWLTSSLLGWVFPDLSQWNGAYVCFAVGGLAAADLFHVALDYL